MTLWKKIKPAKSTQHKQTSTFNVTQFKSFSHLTYNFNNLLNFPTWELGIPHKKKCETGALTYLFGGDNGDCCLQGCNAV